MKPENIQRAVIFSLRGIDHGPYEIILSVLDKLIPCRWYSISVNTDHMRPEFGFCLKWFPCTSHSRSIALNGLTTIKMNRYINHAYFKLYAFFISSTTSPDYDGGSLSFWSTYSRSACLILFSLRNSLTLVLHRLAILSRVSPFFTLYTLSWTFCRQFSPLPLGLLPYTVASISCRHTEAPAASFCSVSTRRRLSCYSSSCYFIESSHLFLTM